MIYVSNVYSKRLLDFLSILCVYFAAIVSLNDAWNPIALYLVLPVTFLLVFIRYDVISTNKSMQFFMILCIWICICYPFSGNFTLANHEMKRIAGSFILCYIISGLSVNQNNIPWLYLIPLIILVSLWSYSINNGLAELDYTKERIVGKVNANTFAYFTFYLTISIFILGEILTGKYRFILRIFFYLMIPISFFTAIYTASRQVALIQVPLIVTLLLNRYGGKKIKNGLILLLIMVICTWAFINFGQDILENSLFKARAESSYIEDVRAIIIKESLVLSIRKPLFGYGPGNSVLNISTGNFTHNTFLELLVNTGVIGMIIFVVMLVHFLKVQYRRWKQTKDNLFKVFILFGIFWTVDQMFYVFYVDLWLISFFMLVSTHADMYFKNKYSFKAYNQPML